MARNKMSPSKLESVIKTLGLEGATADAVRAANVDTEDAEGHGAPAPDSEPLPEF